MDLEQTSEKSLSDLPNDVWTIILKGLDEKSLLVLSQISFRFWLTETSSGRELVQLFDQQFVDRLS